MIYDICNERDRDLSLSGFQFQESIKKTRGLGFEMRKVYLQSEVAIGGYMLVIMKFFGIVYDR